MSALRTTAFALTLTIVACSPRDGEGWAKDTLGEAGAEAIRLETTSVLGVGAPAGILRGASSASAQKPAYVPRPYVVLATSDDPTRPGSTRLVYHATNKRLAADVSGAAGVRGVVVLDADTVSVRGRKGGSSHTEYDVYLVDRAAKVVTRMHAGKPDELEAMLAALPTAP